MAALCTCTAPHSHMDCPQELLASMDESAVYAGHTSTNTGSLADVFLHVQDYDRSTGHTLASTSRSNAASRPQLPPSALSNTRLALVSDLYRHVAAPPGLRQSSSGLAPTLDARPGLGPSVRQVLQPWAGHARELWPGLVGPGVVALPAHGSDVRAVKHAEVASFSSQVACKQSSAHGRHGISIRLAAAHIGPFQRWCSSTQPFLRTARAAGH